MKRPLPAVGQPSLTTLLPIILTVIAAIILQSYFVSEARAAGSLKTAQAIATHPLDPLNAAEIKVLKEVLEKEGQFPAKTFFPWIQLNEPPKAEVLEFKPGAKFRREALVVAISPERKTSYRVIVDLAAKRILERRDLKNLQNFVSLGEYDKGIKAVDESPEMKAALERRGFKVPGKISENFYVDVYAPGNEPLLDNNPTRAMRCLLADRQGGENNYGPYIEGLQALVDLYEGRVIHVIDEPGAVATAPVAHDIFSRTVLGRKRSTGRPLRVSPSTRSNLKLQGNRVQWDNWDFRFSFNIREGLVLHQIGYQDQGKLRPICYRASVSEMLVPYADSAKPWLWREFFDQGEYGLGLLSSSMRAGKELPNNAITFDAVLADEAAELTTGYEDRVFMFERDGGGLLLHSQAGAKNYSRIYARGKELVVGFISTLGNYDYIYQWVFRQDATFGFESELHGMILTKTVDAKRCEVCAAGAEGGPGKTYEPKGAERFGTLVQENIMGVSHQHWFALRLDFDIDGTINAAKECEVKFLPPDPIENAQGRAFMATHTIFATEKDAARKMDFAAKRNWVIYNPDKKSALGHLTGFEILPGANSISALPESRFGENVAFTQRHFWVTKYKPDEMYAAGEYANQASPEYKDHLGGWAADENIFKEDLVAWYSMAYTHVAKPEDFPIMPAGKISVNFAPKGFFEKSPALGLATVEKKKLKN